MGWTAPQTVSDAAPTRSAATVVLLRERADDGVLLRERADDGPEVLLLRRHSRSGFAASAWVFPGGVVDDGDADVPGQTWAGIDPDALAPRFGLSAGKVLALHVAAVRETFEEAGVLLAHHADGRIPDLGQPSFVQARRILNDRDDHLDWGAFCAEQGLVMDLGAVTYHSHWITPIQEPKRYDTYFFVAAVPDGALASQDDVETTQARWMTPREALEDDDVLIIFPTQKTLESLQRFGSAAECAAAAAAMTEIPTVQPHVILDDEGRLVDIVLPDDPRYPHEVYGSETP